jgi:transposase
VRRLLLSLLVCLAPIALAREGDPHIDNLGATAAGGKVTVHFALTGAFARPQLLEGLQSGVPTSFTYVIEIFRDRPNWFDEGIARSRIEVICTFNSVTREYLLNYRRDRRLVRSETFSDLAALQQRMTTIDEVSLFEIGDRRPYKLKVRVKADLMRGWLLYFIPWEISTRWREVRVTAAVGQAVKASRR